MFSVRSFSLKKGFVLKKLPNQPRDTSIGLTNSKINLLFAKQANQEGVDWYCDPSPACKAQIVVVSKKAKRNQTQLAALFEMKSIFKQKS